MWGRKTVTFDLRSDTLTQPTPAMREAMATAEVGDDVYGEDPTVNALEAEAAVLCGKQAALFVPSGTMGNQICLGVLTRPGDEVIADAEAHILINEVGAISRLWGCQVRAVPSARGVLDLDAVDALVRSEGDVHYPRTSVLSIENTHNYAGGTVWPLAALDRATERARAHGLAVHMDGARLLNASVASGVSPARLLSQVDMASICLSKGLGAPVGSIVVGSASRLAEARRVRKLLGGGMRQAGVIAAAARIALREGPESLADDHARARALAEGLAALPGAVVDPSAVHTNILIATTHADAFALERAFAERGVLALALDERRLRFTFHRDVGDDALQAALDAAHALLS